MPGEKQNDIKAKLDGMNTIPGGFQFDHERTWQILHAKLNPSNKKKFAWLYAAAFLLLIAGSFFAIKNGSQNGIPVVNTTRLPKTSNAKKTMELKQSKEEKVNAVTRGSISFVKKANHFTRKIQPVGQTVDSILTGQPIAALPTIVSLDTATKTIVATKPKFKIAHINELNYTEPDLAQTKHKVNMPLLSRKNIPGSDEQVSVEEKTFIQRRKKAALSFLISSSQ